MDIRELLWSLRPRVAMGMSLPKALGVGCCPEPVAPQRWPPHLAQRLRPHGVSPRAHCGPYWNSPWGGHGQRDR